MGTETRIGIVTGLLIVVVASVYFFYGDQAPEDEFLLATGTRVGAPPKIPISDEKKTALRKSRSQSSPRSASPRDTRRLQTGTKRSAPVENRGPGNVLPPTVFSPDGALVNRTRGRSPAAPPRQTSLRTAPSQGLIDATQENLEAAGSSSSRGESGVEQRRTTPSPSHVPKTAGSKGAASDRRTPVRRIAAGSWPKRHRVAAGDTLEAISREHYGDSRRVEAILGANAHLSDPRLLQIGDVLIIPAPGGPAAASHAAGKTASPKGGASQRVASARTYRVKKGETFYSIAKSIYGSGSRWEELYRLNRALVKQDPKGLMPGMVIKLPDSN